MPRRVSIIAMCLCAVAFLVTPVQQAWAKGGCTGDGSPLASGTYTETSPFGPRGNSFHRGVDLAGKVGTSIFAAMDGTVAQAGPASGFGQWIVVDSQTRTGLVSTVYGHMFPDGVLVRQGATVKKGQHIANIGNNGESSGPHLHFEYWEGGRLNKGEAADPSFMLKGSSSTDSTFTEVSSTADCRTGVLKPGLVPPEFAPWILKAGAMCKGIAAPVLAAQLEAENGFRHGPKAPVSSTGAQGPAQFMPGTWRTWGKDYDNSGPPPDVNGIPDAVMSQGALMCENYRLCAAGIANNSLQGDPVALALASYNAGFGAVQRAGGMPSGGDYTTQTQPYVGKIMQRAKAFEASPSLGGGGQVPVVTTDDGGGDGTIVGAATQFKGKKWVWGGGTVDGPTDDGFDGPGLTYFAVAKGTKGKIVLPRTADEQWNIGTEVALKDVEPGDLVFSSWDQRGRPSHVGVAVGNGQIINAEPQRGVVVADFFPDSRARRVT
jgi:murein DD-endopeptidase MepM/ murein hydrolase activator NlpD/cell wall-associated NlpC family hydrolase